MGKSWQRMGSLRSPIALAEPAELAATSRPQRHDRDYVKGGEMSNGKVSECCRRLGVMVSDLRVRLCLCVFLCAVGK